jgi:hypothetical protein
MPFDETADDRKEARDRFGLPDETGPQGVADSRRDFQDRELISPTPPAAFGKVKEWRIRVAEIQSSSEVSGSDQVVPLGEYRLFEIGVRAHAELMSDGVQH